MKARKSTKPLIIATGAIAGAMLIAHWGELGLVIVSILAAGCFAPAESTREESK